MNTPNLVLAPLDSEKENFVSLVMKINSSTLNFSDQETKLKFSVIKLNSSNNQDSNIKSKEVMENKRYN